MTPAKLAIIGSFFCVISGLWAQEAVVDPTGSAANARAPSSSDKNTLTLQQTIDIALAKSDGNAILQKTLDMSRAQYKTIVAQNAYSLNAALGDTGYDGFGNTSLLSSYQSISPYWPASVASSLNTLSSYAGAFGASAAFRDSLSTYTNMSGDVIPQTISGSLAFKGPSTSATLMGSQNVSFAGSPFSESQSVIGLSLTQTVWDGYPGGIPKATVQKGMLSLESAVLTADSSKLNLVYQVRQAYYTTLNAQRGLEMYKQNLERQKSALDQEQTLYDLQQATAVDLQTAKINAKSAEIDLENGTISLSLARKTLSNLVGIPADEDYAVAETEDPEVPTKTLQEAIAIGLDKRVELKQVDLNRKIADVSLGLVKAQTSPTVTVSGGSYMFLDNIQATSAEAVSLGVKIGMPVLDSGSAEYQAESTRYQKEVYDLQDGQYRRSIALGIENAYQMVQLQKDKYELAKSSADNSEAQYELYKVQRQYGTATNQDVLTAAVNMVNARNTAFAARNSLDLAILQLLNAMGM
jgi:outer membrane protein